MIENIYISKQQLAILTVSLASFIQNDHLYEFALNNGTIFDGEIDEYIDCLKTFMSNLSGDEGALLVRKINLNDIDTCYGLDGNEIL